MNKQTAEAIVAAGEEMGKEIELRDSYSGRGMFGDTTHAVVCEGYSDLCSCIAYATSYTEEEQIEDFIIDISGFRFDNMGLSIVVY